jgi:transposase
VDHKTDRQEQHTTKQNEVLVFAMELSAAKWKLGFNDGRRARTRVVTIEAWDFNALVDQVARARRVMGLPEQTPVYSCYEAGREGFSVHRRLTQLGVRNVIIDAASVDVNRRARRAKTDRLDVEKLVEKLMGHLRGEKAFAVLRVPEAKDEAARHEQRELDDLKVERLRHRQRIVAWLLTEGIAVDWGKGLLEALDKFRTVDGRALSSTMCTRIRDEAERLALVEAQIKRIEQARAARLKEHVAEPSAEREQTVTQLVRLKGIGPTSSFRLVLECFGWRKFKNRREVAGFFGLAPTPFASGKMDHEQGIAKLGRGTLRSLMVELSWLWIRFQPDSKLARWFVERFANGGTRLRRIGIIAVARKLAIALWQFVAFGAVPEGALMKP